MLSLLFFLLLLIHLLQLDNLGIKYEQKPMLKVLDFGFADTYRPEEILTVSCGTLEYAAPELLRPKGQVFYKPEAIDVWSAGVCLYAFVTGTLPFEASCDEEFIEKVKDPSSLHIPSHLSPQLQALLRAMLNVDPLVRPSFTQVLQAPWLCNTTNKPAKLVPRDSGSPLVPRKRSKQAKDPSIWRSILHTLKITEP